MAEGVFYTFRFEKNLQGDVVAVYNESGVKVCTYTYDAWGNFTTTWNNGTGTNSYAINNPFTYRGYYYDSETGFYSLQSRYYDPEIGRFINADRQLNDDILGSNLFAYCGNNPVTRTDDSGQGWWIVASAIVGGIVGGITRVVSNVATGNKWNDGIIGAVAGGAVYGGVLAATGNVVAAGYAGAATESVLNEVVSYIPEVSKINGQSSTKKVTKTNVLNFIKTVAIDTAINGTISTITGKIAGKIVPTNRGWFQPQKFLSSFIGKYAIKSTLQSLTQGGLLFGYEELKYAVDQRVQGQQPTVTFFPDTEIQTAR